MLAAGTFTRSVGLYDDHGNGGTVAVFPLQSDNGQESGEDMSQGTGITQLLWSECSRYLCVVERGSDGMGVWDIRGAGRQLAWLRGRNALTPQRLGAEAIGHEVWAGGTDGRVRVWERLGTKEGSVDPVWEFRAHDGPFASIFSLSPGGMRTQMLIRRTDAVCATTLHPSGSVLATASGQHHLRRRCRDDTREEEESDEDKDEMEEMYDSSLKLWAL